ncbi:MAG: endonuclease dU, partial [Pseudobdellovibrionaceae bacterium]
MRLIFRFKCPNMPYHFRVKVLEAKEFRAIKSEIRVLGVDDGKFIPHTQGSVIVVGIVFRGGCWLDGVMHTSIAIDGFDATEQIGSMINSSRHCKQLRVIMLNGITFAGFNVVNVKRLNFATDLPVIA